MFSTCSNTFYLVGIKRDSDQSDILISAFHESSAFGIGACSAASVLISLRFHLQSVYMGACMSKPAGAHWRQQENVNN